MTAAVSAIIRAHRIFTRKFNIGEATPQSIVMVSLTEMRRSNSAGPLDTPFIGDATMKVYNVAPQHGAVWVRGEVDWDSDLDIKVDILVN